MMDRALKRGASRALDRQLAFQRQKAAKLHGHEQRIMATMLQRSQAVREKLETVAPIPEQARVLEVGCGSVGHIFFFGAAEAVGVDPLADHYRILFPAWQGRARTIAAGGENLPLPDSHFDVVICDNVVDHAENPRRILEEICRVLAPNGLLYFTVNVHHPAYQAASSAHALWRALGIPFEVTPFADHTVHLTLDAARRLFSDLPLRMVAERDAISEVKIASRRSSASGLGAMIKRLLFKNARYEVIAIRN